MCSNDKYFKILNKKDYKTYFTKEEIINPNFLTVGIFKKSKYENNKIFNGKVMGSCSICYDNIYDFEKNVNLNCSHTYHKKCLEKWMINTPKNSCPMCRSSFDYTEIKFQTKTKSYSNQVCKNILQPVKLLLNNEEYKFNQKQMEMLYKECPIEWKSTFDKVKNSNKRSTYLEPIFSLGNLKISSWLRINILFGNERELKIVKCGRNTENKNLEYYDILNKELNGFEYKSFQILYTWVFDMMHKIDKEYKLPYCLIKNTDILNTIFSYISKKEIEKDDYLKLGFSAIYLAHEKKLNFESLCSLNNNHSVKELRDFTKEVEKVI